VRERETCLMALFPGLPGWAGTRKVKPIWILLEQVTVSGSVICWAICKSAPRCRQITMPAPHHSVFTGRMPFLPPSQQRDSTEGNSIHLATCMQVNKCNFLGGIVIESVIYGLVCLLKVFVCHNHEPYKKSWIDCGAVWDVDMDVLGGGQILLRNGKFLGHFLTHCVL